VFINPRKNLGHIMLEEDGIGLDTGENDQPRRQKSQRLAHGNKDVDASAVSPSGLMNKEDESKVFNIKLVEDFLFRKEMPLMTGNGDATRFDLAGYLICQTCFSTLIRQGFLAGNPKSSSCLMKREHQIQGSSEGNRSRALWLHRLLCEDCHSRASENELNYVNGNLSLKSCSYILCKRPYESVHFYAVDGKSTSGGKDWTMMDGWTLCKTCYCQYFARGNLTRNKVTRPAIAKQDDATTIDTSDSAKASHDGKTLNSLHDGGKREGRPGLGERTLGAKRRLLSVCIGQGAKIASIVPVFPVECCGACGNNKEYHNQGKWFIHGCTMCRKCIQVPCIEYDADSIISKAEPSGGGATKKSRNH
jgi:hypothetical protein